jgi:nickel/cobalt exporter
MGALSLQRGPCSGAILVLVFALAQGLFWVGVGSTFMMGLGTFITVAAIATMAVAARGWAGRFAASRPRYGTVAIRGIELASGLVVIRVRWSPAHRLHRQRAYVPILISPLGNRLTPA